MAAAAIIAAVEQVGAQAPAATHAAIAATATVAQTAAIAAQTAAIVTQAKPGSHNAIKAQMNIGSCQ